MIIPTISSGIAGPLGVLHMPRFWQKVSLDAVGKLHSDYPACGAGYDQMMLDAIGLDKDATLAYIKENKPTYVQFEAWVKENASNLGGAEGFNAACEGYNHADETRESILNTVGLPGADIKDAINLNNLEDWHDFHGSEIA
ncbi:MAG: DUF5069 domain-containing protein [Verrucomicrobiales bacterium]|nr:DUF5069 domain-containing protein [Verrucomicrobiales bacterium]